MAKKLYVRYSTAADEGAIFDFYAQNQHAFVYRRDPEIWRERITNGAVTLIEDEDGKILASGISYPLTKKTDEGEAHMWTEIGSVRVAKDGIGLFGHLVSAHVMRAYMLEPPEDRFAIEIMQGNTHSHHVFCKAGATPFDIPPELAQKVSATIAPDATAQPVDWYQLGVETIPAFAKQMLHAEANPKLTDKKTGDEYELDFSKNVLMNRFRDALKETAGSDFGDVKKPDFNKGLTAFRKKINP